MTATKPSLVSGKRRKIMYVASLPLMWGVRSSRSLKKSTEEGPIMGPGISCSLSMVANRPRWVGEETRELKAIWSSWEAVEEVAVSRSLYLINLNARYLQFPTAS